MATTRDYLGYLNEKIEIAPANSQEELLAAETIQQIMDEHGLETSVQEFDAPSKGAFMHRLLMLVLFLGVFLAGLQGTPAAIVGIVLIVLAGVFELLSFFGIDVLAGIGPRARSQNVIGVHRAEGPLVAKGNRPIVIVAHYDTARESFLYARPFARFQKLLLRLAPIFVVLACVFGLIQVLGFIPGGARRIIWVIGIIASLPLLLLGAEGIYTCFSSWTDGANDNKTGVAAMLGVLGMVRPGEDSADGYEQALLRATREPAPAPQPVDEAEPDASAWYEDEEDESAAAAEDDEGYDEQPAADDAPYEDEDLDEDAYARTDDYGQDYAEEEELPTGNFEPVEETGDYEDEPPAAEPAPVDEIPAFLRPVAPAAAPEPVRSDPIPQVVTERYEEVHGIRHGRDVLADLRMLPTSCEIVYVEPQLVSRSVRPQAVASTPASPSDEGIGFISAGDGVARTSVYDAYDAYEDDVYADDEPSRFAGIADKARGFFGSIKERFSQVRERLSKRGEGEDEPAEVERTGVYEPLPELDDSEVLDFGIEEEPIAPVAPRPARKSRRAARDEESEPLRDEPTSYESAPSAAESHYDYAASAEPAETAWQSAPAPTQTYEYEPAPVAAPAPAVEEVADTAEFEPVSAPEPVVATAQDSAADILAPGITFEHEPEPTEEEMAMRDVAGLDAEVVLDPDATAPHQVEERPRPASVDDPSWGKSEYQPQTRGGFGRRAALYDLPDPSSASSDPFASDAGSTARDLGTSDRRQAAARPRQETPAPAAAPAPAPASQARAEEQAPARRQGFRRGRRQEEEAGQSLSEWLGVSEDFDAKRDGAAIGTWDNFDDEGDGKRWKGGATTRAGLRNGGVSDDGYADAGYPDAEYADAGYQGGAYPAEDDYYAGGYGEDHYYEPEGYVAPNPAYAPADPFAEEAPAPAAVESVPGPEQLREAILSMGDDELVAHDIWFVALGSSELDHAGIKSFLAEYRSKIRGAFLVNLDSVGAGELTTYTREGLFASRRTDRRVERLLGNIADDLHISLGRATHDHRDTDATPAMRASVRALTIQGTTDDGVPALSHTADDVIENVDAAQVTAVADMVAELIRRA